MRIIFIGTSEFGVPSLEALVKSKHQVKAVVTIPDQKSGRGQKVKHSAIKKIALKYNIPLLQPQNLEDQVFITQLKEHDSELQIVIAFKKLPKSIWNLPKYGTVNLHASLLPKYRGAAPIHWAILNGEQKTGITTFFINNELDTGDIISQKEMNINPKDTTGMLYKRLMKEGPELILNTIQQIENNTYEVMKQSREIKISHSNAPKITKEIAQINWQKSQQEILNLIRAMNPIPATWSILKGKYYKIHEADEKVPNSLKLQPGGIASDQKTYLYIGSKDKPINVIRLQAAGKKIMRIRDFFLGNQI